MSVASISSAPPLVIGNADFTGNLTPDSLYIYLQSRLDGLDAQVDTIFNDQKRQQAAQGLLRDIQTKLDTLNDKEGGTLDAETTEKAPVLDPESNVKIGDEDKTVPGTGAKFKAEVDKDIAELAKLDPSLAKQIGDTLSQGGQVFAGGDNTYSGAEVATSKSFLDNIGKDLESAASLNMIRLQSIMSSRQTAIQLATNMTSSLGEGPKAIVSNIGH